MLPGSDNQHDACLRLEVTVRNGEPLPVPLVCELDQRSGTLGRADSNDLVLPDEDGVVHVPLDEIDAVFITHYHNDHYADLGDVMEWSWINGRRHILPHAKVMIHQPYGGVTGQTTDIQIQAEQIIAANLYIDTPLVLPGLDQADADGIHQDPVRREVARHRLRQRDPRRTGEGRGERTGAGRLPATGRDVDH